jgi:hypothetical protein
VVKGKIYLHREKNGRDTLRPEKTQRNLVKLCLEDGAADLLVRVADEALDDGVDLRHRLA